MTTTASTPSLVLADPTELVIGENIRTDVVITDDPEFVRSIAERGVLTAISATRRADGTLRIIDGQRRILAAREAGLSAVPVLVDTESDDERQAQIDRVTGQLHTNEQRAPITTRHKVGAVTELLDLGLDVERVAKITQLGEKFTRTAATAGRSAKVDDHLANRRLTLDDAAILAELETAADRYPAIPDRIERILGGYGISYHLAHLREDVAAMDAATAAATEYAQRGFTVIHNEPSTTGGDWFTPADLRTPDGEPIPDDAPHSAPHLWHVHPSEAGAVWIDADGHEVDDTLIDWDTRDDPDLEAIDGLIRADAVTKTTSWSFEFYLHHSRRADAGFALAPELAAAGGDAGDAEDGLSPSQRAAARAEAERKDADRAQRRRTIALNRAGGVATEMRRAFLTGLLSAKSAPKNTTRWVVGVLARHPSLLTEFKAGELYGSITGADPTTAAAKAAKATAAQCEVLLLARVLTAFEARLTGTQDSKDYWRYGEKSYRGLQGIDAYLTFLADAGHTLSPVEQAAIGNTTVDAAYATLDDD
ncbi:ParB/RepB/Spo0J family partition protein [Rhodococcoides kroppenstedtii]|uniref:ParB/RepB/Spo0J family partition protein n=1 Tax=Rhodococcoides kroppenstedtii TaxID=293050 RepID=UPI0028E49C9A|nr:ParB/RepB/Spo0J family partition protein [Rhodococcus kroppenstedtii]